MGPIIAALTSTLKNHVRFSFSASTDRGDAFKVISAAWFSFRTQTRPYGGDKEFCRRAYARRGNGRYRFDVKIDVLAYQEIISQSVSQSVFESRAARRVASPANDHTNIYGNSSDGGGSNSSGGGRAPLHKTKHLHKA